MATEQVLSLKTFRKCLDFVGCVLRLDADVRMLEACEGAPAALAVGLD
jgi:hypothetical protein